MRLARVLPIALILTLGLSACQALFTTSLGTALVRKTITIPADISASDAKDILASDPSPEACASLLDVLNAQTGASSAGLAVDAAIGASELSTTLGSSVGDAAAALISGGAADFSGILTSLRSVGSDAAVLTAFQGLGSGSSVDADVIAAAGLSATDLALVALVIAAQAIPAGITDPTALTGTALTDFQATPQAQLAVALLGEAAAGLTDSTYLDLLSGFLPVAP